MFYPKLYLSPKLKKKKRKIVSKIKNGKFVPGVYVITLSNGSNLMEFYQSFQLLQPYFKENMPYIIGLANGYEEAIDLVQKILLDAFAKTGEYNVNKLILGDNT